MNRVAYFAATGVSTGRELWRSNGTAVGTWRVRDIVPGLDGSHPEVLTVMGSALYFRAYDSGSNLWRSDGTEAGTTRVTSGINFPRDLVVQGQRLFFVADDPSNGAQIWRTEGTPASTIRLTSIAGLNPAFLTRLGNNTLLFSGISGGLGREPHRLINLQLTGIVEIAGDIAPGSASSEPVGFMVHEGVGYFSANNGSHGRELWRTDGTPAGTWLLADLVPGGGGGAPECLAWLNDRLYFRSGTTGMIYRSDGTTPGTRTVATSSRWGCGFTALGARILYWADQSHNVQTGLQPWVLFADAIYADAFQ